MTINLKSTLELQKKLDDRIESNAVKTEQEKNDVVTKKLLAFIVELCELANETRCFKYWSKKSASQDSYIYEEYADGLHFLLSIGLTKKWENFDFTFTSTKTSNKMLLVKKFNEIINLSSSYFQNQSEDFSYFIILNSYLELGGFLGMTAEDILSSYNNKNIINHKRQDEGY